MKKSLIYTLAFAALIISTSLTAAISSSATTEQNTPQTTLEVSSNLANPNQSTSLSRNENVYVITNPTGRPTSSFIGSTINTSNEPLPLTMHITYYLNGTEINPADLIGKSGHIKITYTFTATKTYRGKLVPFLTVTGLTLDSTKFSNLQIDHGKIISESDQIVLAGYTFVGLNENLGTNLLSNNFTIEADTTNFALSDSYTSTTNEIFADFDTTKLSSLDGLIDSVNDLGSAFDRILAGSTDLANGAHDLASGASQLATSSHDLASGANQVNSGAKDLATGAAQLSDGLTQLVDFNNNVLNKIDTTTTTVTTTIQELIEKYDIDPNSDLIKRINSSLTEYYSTAYTAVTTYIGNIAQLSAGANQLTAGANQLVSGTTALATGANQLANGADQLSAGAAKLSTGNQTLKNGLLTFKQQGIDRLINFANEDLSNFLENTRATVTAANSYHHYTNPNAKNVKFIFKTPSLK